MKKKAAPKKGSLRGGQSSGDPEAPPVNEGFEQSAMQKLLSVASSQLSGGAKKKVVRRTASPRRRTASARPRSASPRRRTGLRRRRAAT
jgi:hypothetical protein